MEGVGARSWFFLIPYSHAFCTFQQCIYYISDGTTRCLHITSWYFREGAIYKNTYSRYVDYLQMFKKHCFTRKILKYPTLKRKKNVQYIVIKQKSILIKLMLISFQIKGTFSWFNEEHLYYANCCYVIFHQTV